MLKRLLVLMIATIVWAIYFWFWGASNLTNLWVGVIAYAGLIALALMLGSSRSGTSETK